MRGIVKILPAYGSRQIMWTILPGRRTRMPLIETAPGRVRPIDTPTVFERFFDALDGVMEERRAGTYPFEHIGEESALIAEREMEIEMEGGPLYYVDWSTIVCCGSRYEDLEGFQRLLDSAKAAGTFGRRA